MINLQTFNLGKSWHDIHPLFKAILWSLTTILIAFITVFYFDFFVILMDKNTDVDLDGLIKAGFQPDKIFDISVALMSALIVEQIFVRPRPSQMYVFTLPGLGAAVIIIILFSLNHHKHQKPSVDYKGELEKVYTQFGLDSTYQTTLARIDTAKSETTRSRLFQRLIDFNSDEKNQWAAVSVQLNKGNQIYECPCKTRAFYLLAIGFVISVLARWNMLTPTGGISSNTVGQNQPVYSFTDVTFTDRQYWSGVFGCSYNELRAALNATGSTNPEIIRAHVDALKKVRS